MLVLIIRHPSTVERCLCFDDALSCLSSMAGVTLGRWFSATQNFPPAVASQSASHGTSSSLSEPLAYSVVVILKIVLGVGALLGWRMAVKTLLGGPLRKVFMETPTHKIAKLDPVPSVVDIPALHPAYRQTRESLDAKDPRNVSTKGDDERYVLYRFPRSEGAH